MVGDNRLPYRHMERVTWEATLGYGSIAMLITIAAVKTVLTKLIFVHVPTPIAYSLLSAVVTALLLVPSLAVRGFGILRREMMVRFMLVCVAVAVDLGMNNIAIWLLPLALQQAIASTIPGVTVVLESIVRRRRKSLGTYLVIGVLCGGAVLSHLGTRLDSGGAEGGSGEIALGSGEVAGGEGARGAGYVSAEGERRLLGECAMAVAIFAAACKYVFAKETIHACRQELGAISLLFWIEVFITAILLPWAYLNGELATLLTAQRSGFEWCMLCSAAALGGFRFFCELLVLHYWSATSLSAANLTAHAVIIIVAISAFGTGSSPLQTAGLLLTMAASAAYALIKARREGPLLARKERVNPSFSSPPSSHSRPNA
jgi:hypothetical protein